MLRSLVGSEMCIRDRYGITVCSDTENIICTNAIAFCPVCTTVNGFLRVCLLYTSDAADDLLCVDLGGRRIIKKKTKKNKQNNI